MCRGVPQESIEGSGMAHISRLHQYLRQAADHDHEHHDGDALFPDRSAKIMAPRDRGVDILISRGNPVVRQAAQVFRSSPLGLAIVAALHESRAGTSTMPSWSGHVVQRAADYSCLINSSRQMRPISALLRPIETRRFKDAPLIELKIAGDRNNGAAKSSIFSITSSPLEHKDGPDCMSSDSCSPDHYFLGACVFCQRQLAAGKDIYMYRGDRAFCSSECRYRHIIVDERMELSLQRVRPLANQRPAVPHEAVKVCSSIAVLT